MTYFLCIIIFILGLLIGSFLNVCIYRLPKHENIVYVSSHCMSCGYRLKWYDLFPVVSYVCLGGKCRKCKTKLSVQYPLIELLNGVAYLFIFMIKGINVESLLCSFLFSALLVLSVIDFRTYEIPDGINVFILAMGLIRSVLDYSNWPEYVIGLFAVSIFLWLLYQISKGKAIGGGDVKLMGAAGLFLGWKNSILAFALGCILGAIIHVTRMQIAKSKGKEMDNILAMGPYLSFGICIAMVFGENIISWYMTMCGF